MINYTAEQKLERVTATILRTKELAFYWALLVIGKREVVDDVKTACTNGRDEKYGREFVLAMSEEELLYTRMHEQEHKLLRHISVWKHLWDKDAATANKAADYVVNARLENMREDYPTLMQIMRMPEWKHGPDIGKPMGLYDPQYIGMDVGQVFDLLADKTEPDEPGDDPSDEPEDGDGPTGDGPEGNEPDDGDGPEGDGPTGDGPEGDEPDDGDGKGKGKEKGGKPGRGPGTGEAGDHPSFDEHDTSGANDLTKDEEDELAREIDRAVRQGIYIAGKMGINVGAEITQLTEVTVDWREVMREFVKASTHGGDEVTWRKFNRKLITSDIYAPTTENIRAGSIAVMNDMSGSITQGMINACISNVVSICQEVKPEKVVLGYWDTSLRRVEIYDDSNYESLLETTKPCGGGGTDVRCVANYLRGDTTDDRLPSAPAVDCVIVLTDGIFSEGQGDWGDLPVLWCVIDPYHRSFVPVTGVVVPVKL